MKREEAIYELQLCVDAWDKWMLPGCSSLDKHKEAIKMALAALRPVSREQVENVWRGEWVHKKSPYDYKIFVCKKCEKQISIQGEPLIFCPACGAPMTDEAVDIILQRLEELKNEAIHGD